ncbi:hypothetical protein ACFY9H_14680 [Streptomyces bacillaris]|uniref:Uncharacterized protein n=1 Tax=Streptomyces cavourensis TaxID=67258 RepID=A0AAD0Q0M0_9ACTN|nr:hypothetical protein [Streptomyces cavourensis]AXI70061.1 hypothetical protein DTW94_01275 [Streptomyces cavourensis]
MSSDPSGAAEQEPVGGFITEPLVVAAATTGGCCGEPADATGAVPGGQGGGCCGEPASAPEPARSSCCGEPAAEETSRSCCGDPAAAG